jgi:hypothetical protein
MLHYAALFLAVAFIAATFGVFVSAGDSLSPMLTASGGFACVGIATLLAGMLRKH